MRGEGKFWYRIVDKDGEVVDGDRESRYLRTLAEAVASTAWHNSNYPESKPHRIQRTTRERVWEER